MKLTIAGTVIALVLVTAGGLFTAQATADKHQSKDTRYAPDQPGLAVATFAGRRRPPTRIGRSLWGQLPQAGDQGARDLLADRPDLVVEVPCPGDPADVDTMEDLWRWT